MTDKEIIIDGVNVAGCYFCKNSFELTDFEGIQKCSEIKDCFYKQLQDTLQQYNQVVEQNKNLEQELNKCQVEIENLDTECALWEKQNYKLKQECEELKEKLTEAKAMNLALDLLEREKELKHYQQALEKIDNIVTSAGYGIEDKSVMAIIEPILKTINEVKNEQK